MKLTVSQRVEQGTHRGVMKFRPGREYPVQETLEGYLVTHEPRVDWKRVTEGDTSARKPVEVTQTLIPRAVMDKLAAVATLEG